MRRPGRAARARERLAGALRGLATTLALAVTFLAAAFGGLAAHLDLPPFRRIVRDAANDVLGSLFRGAIVVERVDHVSLRGVEIGAARVDDAFGDTIIRAEGIRARADVLGIVTSVLSRGDLRVAIGRVRVDQADVLIEPSRGGPLGIAEAFLPRAPAAPPPPGEAPKGRAVRVLLPSIEIGRAHARGLLAAPRSLDADVTRLVASIRVEPEAFTLDVARAGLVDRAFLPATTSGTADYHLRVFPGAAPGDPGVVRMWTELVAQIGAVQTQARATLENGHLAATLDVPSATPTEIASLVPGLAVAEPVTLHAELDGPIPSFDVRLAAWLRPGWGDPRTILAEGRFEAASPVRFAADVELRDMDPSAIDARLPVGRIAAEGRVVAELAPTLRVSVDARTSAGIVADQLVPPAAVHLDLVPGGLVATAALAEPGAPVDAFVDARGGAVAFEADADVPSLGAAPRLARVAQGAASAHVSGTLREGRLDARVTALGYGLRAEGVSLESAIVRGRVRGPLDALELEAEAQGTALATGAYRFHTANARADGPLAAPRVRASLHDGAGGDVEASGRVDARRRAIVGVELDVARGSDRVRGKVARVGAAPGGVVVEGVALDGGAVGSLRGGLVVQGGDVTGKLRGESVDLEKLGHLIGRDLHVKGLADVDVDLARADGGGHDGHVLVELEGARVEGVDGFSAHLTASFEGARVRADGLVRLLGAPSARAGDAPGPCEGVVASVLLEGGDGALRGPLLSAATWRALTGAATVRADRVRLGCLAQKAPLVAVAMGLSPTAVAGDVYATATVSRPEGQRFPSVKLDHLATDGLEVGAPLTCDTKAAARDDEPAPAAAPPTPAPTAEGGAPAPATATAPSAPPCRPIDVAIDGKLDAATGATAAHFHLRSGKRLLASGSAEATLDLATLVDHPARRAASLRATPFRVQLSVPEAAAAAFRALPPLVGAHVPIASGTLGLDAYADGTLAEPFVTVKARGAAIEPATGLGQASPAAWAFPVDVEARGTYDARRATLDASIEQGRRRIGAASVELEVALDELLAGATPRVTGGVHVELGEPAADQSGALDGFVKIDPTRGGLALGEIAALASRDIAGRLRGTLSMTGLGSAPLLTAKLVASDLVLGAGEPALQASLLAWAREREAAATLMFTPSARPDAPASSPSAKDRPKQPENLLTFNAHANVDWVADLVPLPDLDARGTVSMTASKFGLGVARPLVSAWLSNVGGTVDGHAVITWNRLDDGAGAGVSGEVTVTDAFVNLPQLGQELHAPKVVLSAAGQQRIRVAIPATNGRDPIAATGVIELDGARFRRAEADVRLANDLPITVEGVPLGNARGELRVQVENRPEALDVDVTIPRLHVELPAAPRLGVQSLDDDPSIAVRPAAGPAGGAAKAGDGAGSPVVVHVRADEIQIEGEAPGGGKALDLVLRTRTEPSASDPGKRVDVERPRFELGDRLVVTGDIEAVRGKVDVYGKLFELDQGFVRLRPEDPSNPYVNVLAHWDAPDGSRITVGYSGTLDPITDEKLVLRSDPPRAGGRQAILAALLFGVSPTEGAQATTATPADASQTGPLGSKAVGVGGSLATAQLSALLSGTLLRGLSARFGTTAEGKLATTLQYQLGQKVIAAATFQNAGAAAAGTTGGTAGSSSATPTTPSATTRANRTEISIDWRFAQRWSLRATLGVAADQPNSGLDLLWQYRY